jgi:hypothetical protein
MIGRKGGATERRAAATLAGVDDGMKIKDWRVPFRTQRVETEGVSKSEDIEIN